MRFRRRKQHPLHLDITPLVDVVFLLLIFFMVTTTFSSAREMRLNLPRAETGEKIEENKQQVVVTVDKTGHYSIQGKPIADGQVKSGLAAAIAGDRMRTVAIQADKKASHGAVVRILDAARSLNLNRLVIATLPDNTGP